MDHSLAMHITNAIDDLAEYHKDLVACNIDVFLLHQFLKIFPRTKLHLNVKIDGSHSSLACFASSLALGLINLCIP